MEELTTREGTVQSVIFQNEENGYTVLRLVTEEGELITVVGCIPCAAPGEHLGVSGACDVLEFCRGGTGVPLTGREGLWQPFPVEYKRGRPKEHDADALQLCGQAMCLEEMLCCEIPAGALYYGEIRRRKEVAFTPEFRQEVRTLLAEMHSLYDRGHTPRVKPTKGCNACSLKELCMPKLMKNRSVAAYLKTAMEETP